MKTRDVHVYAVVRLKVLGVPGRTQQQCLKNVEIALGTDDIHRLFDGQTPGTTLGSYKVDHFAYADEVAYYLVDERNDRTHWYANAYAPDTAYQELGAHGETAREAPGALSASREALGEALERLLSHVYDEGHGRALPGLEADVAFAREALARWSEVRPRQESPRADSRAAFPGIRRALEKGSPRGVERRGGSRGER